MLVVEIIVVLNPGALRDTMLPGSGRSRWLLSTSIPHIFILECGDDSNQVTHALTNALVLF